MRHPHRRIPIRQETSQAPPEIPHTYEDLAPETHHTRLRSYAAAIGWTIATIFEAANYLEHTAAILSNQATTTEESDLYAKARHVAKAIMRATSRLGTIHRKALRGPRNPPRSHP